MQQRPDAGEAEKPIVHSMYAVQERMLFDRDAMMVVLLPFENINRPTCVVRDELLIGGGAPEEASCQRFVLRAQRRDGISSMQMLARIEYPRVPIGLGMFAREIDQRRDQRQVPAELGGRARPQPLSLPVVPMPLPVDPAHDTDDGHFADRPQPDDRMQYMATVIPSERERQNREQYGDRTQHVDGPVAAAIAVPVMDRAFIERLVVWRNSFDERQQQSWRPRRRWRWQRLDVRADQQQALDGLVQRHRPLNRGFRRSLRRWLGSRCPNCHHRSQRANRRGGR